ncbi:Eukaryotic translation initiation factor 4G, putative isoform 2 [Hibiscus syriacus]|uniref:Eukaryotic translation initiation factor 4G, putative isoform 2 n=1 Tax=Hibiscus syriacus TaxID=106335 RepID=A0A6A3CJX2_HIBSY|nr:Eukaryotic translation initiation factor 4G, putative isoform 2 [Hibiscus syriacus]
MSFNQSRFEKSEHQYRKSRRSKNFNQQRTSTGHCNKGAGGVPAPSPSLSSSSSNRSFKKTNNAQGAQSQATSPGVNSSNVQNGAHVHPQLQGASDKTIASSTANPVESVTTQRSTRAVPKAPTSQLTTVNSDGSPMTPTKASGDASKVFSLQFGSISPGFMNGMQISVRTSSAPPNLDEQKRDQACHDSSFRYVPDVPTPVPKQQQPKRILQPSNRILGRPRNCPSVPMNPMQRPFHHQPQVSMQFGMPSPPIQSPTSMQMPIHIPLPMENASQVQQQVFVPGLQAHQLSPQGMMHQGQGLGFSPPIGGQLPPHLGSLGMGIAPQYPQQQGGKFGVPRKTTPVKITHPDTHEELRLDKRTGAHADGGASGPRTHPNVPSQSQPIPSFAAHSGHENISFVNSAAAHYGSVPGLVQVSVKPTTVSVGEKVVDSPLSSSFPAFEKVRSLKPSIPASEVSSSQAQTDLDACQGSSVQQPKPGTESLTSKSYSDAAKQPWVFPTTKLDESPPFSSIFPAPAATSEKSMAVVVSNDSKKDSLSDFNSTKDNQMKANQSTSASSLASHTAEHGMPSGCAVSKTIEAKTALTSSVVTDVLSQHTMELPAVNNASPPSLEPKADSKSEGLNLVSSDVSGTGSNIDSFDMVRHAKTDGSSTLDEQKHEISVIKGEEGKKLLEEQLTDDATLEIPSHSVTLNSKELNSNKGSASKAIATSNVPASGTSKMRESLIAGMALPLELLALQMLKLLIPQNHFKYEREGVQVPSSKERSVLDIGRKRTNTTRGKKKRKEILQKADAAGTTSDLYMAYKGPEEKKETNKAEPDDWEDAANISTAKLGTSDNGERARGGLVNHEKVGSKNIAKKYSRDFLLKFSEKCTDLPPGFEIASDIVDSLMVTNANASHFVDRDSYSGSGRIMNRQFSGSRQDCHASGMVDDDRWIRQHGSFGPGRDLRVDLGYAVAGFRPGQGGNFGVLRHPRGQAPLTDGKRTANYQQKGFIPSPQTPLQMMHKTERKYEVGKVAGEEESKQRQLKAILNKLTPQNFEKLFEQVKTVNIDNAATLGRVISQIFDKALMEPTFCEMYADFCYHLAGVLPDFSEKNEKITFKRLLLNKCQEEFERGEREQEEANKVEQEGEAKQSEEGREKRIKARRRMLVGNRGGKFEGPKKIEEVHRDAAQERQAQTSRLARCPGINAAARRAPMDFGPRGSMLSSPGFQMGNYRAMPTQARGSGAHDSRMDDRQYFEARTLSVPLPQRPMGDDSITLGDSRRVTTGLNGFNSQSERATYGSREDRMPRYGTERSAVPTAYDYLNSQERGMNFGNWVLITALIDLPLQLHEAKDPVQLKVFLRKSAGLWSTYVICLCLQLKNLQSYSARDEKEVALCIKDLNSPSFHPSMIALFVTDSFERKDVGTNLAKLLVNLTRFEYVFSTLEDAVNDAPKAAEFLGQLMAKLIIENVVSLKDIGLLYDGGEEPGRLREIGLAGDVLGSALGVIKTEKGESVFNEIRGNCNLRLEDFRPPDPYKSRLLETFL